MLTPLGATTNQTFGYLDTYYFIEIKKLLLTVLKIEVKVSWNSTVKCINSIKKYSKDHK